MTPFENRLLLHTSCSFLAGLQCVKCCIRITGQAQIKIINVNIIINSREQEKTYSSKECMRSSQDPDFG